MGEVMRNSEVFGPVLRPLTKPSYVLRMAQHGRQWSRDAQVKHLRIMRFALAEALGAVDRSLSLLAEEEQT